MNEFSDLNQNQESGGIGVGANSLTKDLSLASIVKLKQCFLQLEEGLDKIEGRQEGYLLPGDAILSIMAEAGFSSVVIPRLAVDLDGVSSFLTGNNHEASGCDKFGSILRVLSSNSLARSPKIFSESYKVIIHSSVSNWSTECIAVI